MMTEDQALEIIVQGIEITDSLDHIVVVLYILIFLLLVTSFFKRGG